MRCPPRKVACIEQMWPKKEAFFSHRKRDLCCPVVYIRVPRSVMKMKELLFSLIVWSCLDMFCYDCTRLLNVIYLYIFRSMKLYFTSSQSACCLQSFVWIFFFYLHYKCYHLSQITVYKMHIQSPSTFFSMTVVP